MENRSLFSRILGHKLREIREDRDLSNAEMAKVLKVSHTLVNYYENGKRIPSIDMIRVYGNKFNVDFIELFELRVECIKESYMTLNEDANVNLKNEYDLIMYYEEKLNKREG